MDIGVSVKQNHLPKEKRAGKRHFDKFFSFQRQDMTSVYMTYCTVKFKFVICI